jgi:hypothetical protein
MIDAALVAERSRTDGATCVLGLWPYADVAGEANAAKLAQGGSVDNPNSETVKTIASSEVPHEKPLSADRADGEHPQILN